MTVRSAVLARIHVASAGIIVAYTCPAGVTTLLKNIQWEQSGGHTGTIDIWLQDAANTVFPSLINTNIASNSYGSIQTWIALGPNDTIRLLAPLTTDIWISGTKLDGVAA